MPNDYSPDAIRAAFDLVKHGTTIGKTHYSLPGAVLSGIKGDEEHYAEGGYHVPRHAVQANDYSVMHPEDRRGDPYAASALDVKFPSGPDSTMTLVTRRVWQAMHNRDPRVDGMVEVGGTIDGRRTFAYYRYSNTYEIGTWDDSHLWHVHLSGRRMNVNFHRPWHNVALVMLGVPMTRSQRVRAAARRKAARVAYLGLGK